MAAFQTWLKLERSDPARAKGYKYRTTKPVKYQSRWLKGAVRSEVVSSGKFIRLLPSGRMRIKQGYCWDGASGPTFDTRSTMLGSLVHDALYQLMREELLSRGDFKSIADIILRRICIEQGMGRWRANFWVWAVLTFGRKSAGG